MRSNPWTIGCALLLLGSGCFKSREEKLKAAEDQGNLAVATKAKLVEGVGKALKEEGALAAEKVTEGTGEVLKAMGKGFDKSLQEVKLTLHPELAPKGISATRAAVHGEGSRKHSVSVFVQLERGYQGPLELRAYDTDDQEVGRAKVTVEEKESNARYIDFDFDPRTPLLTAGHFELR